MFHPGSLRRKDLREPQGALQIPPVGRDDKGRGVTQVGVVTGWEVTAGPSTSLRFGRDDKGRGVSQVRVVAGWEVSTASSVPSSGSTQRYCNLDSFISAHSQLSIWDG